MSVASLTYLDHAPNPDVACSICLEPVAQKAIKVSCHGNLNCAECMGYWMESQIHASKKTTCPRCRTTVDPRNLTAPNASIEWQDVQNMEWEESEDDWDDGEVDEDDVKGSFGGNDEMDEHEAGPLSQFWISGTNYRQRTGQTSADEEELNLTVATERNNDLDGSVSSKVEEISGKENIKDEVMRDEGPVPSTARLRRNTRHHKVQRVSLPQHEILELLRHHEGNIPFDFMAHNTYFVPNLSYDTSILICGIYHHTAGVAADEYFFWVHEGTTIGDLVALWIADEPKDHIQETENWFFNGKALGWPESVTSCGMRHGSRFEIRRAFQ